MKDETGNRKPESGKRGIFAAMIAARARAFDLTYDRPRTTADAILEMQEHLGMIGLNEEDGDTREAMLENLAELICAADRLRDLLLLDADESELARALEEMREGNSDLSGIRSPLSGLEGGNQ